MKKMMRWFMALCVGWASVNVIKTDIKAASDPVRILFTHDLMDHIDPYKTLNEENESVTYGGYAYLASAVSQYSNERTVVLDAGNFSTGTMYASLSASSAPDLALMKAMGYDAVTLGSADFRYGAERTGQMLKTAGEGPALVAANLEFASGAAGTAMKEGWAAAGGSSGALIDAGPYTVGVFGIMDPDENMAEEQRVTVTDQLTAASDTVNALKKEGADLVVCLYSTVQEDLSEFAAGVSADVIIAGGSYPASEQYEKAGSTVIVSADQYGKSLGLLDIDPSDGSVAGYEKIQISDSSFEADEEISEMISGFRTQVQDKIMKRFGLDTEKPAFRAPYSLTTYERLSGSRRYAEAADLVTDSMIEAYSPSSSDEAKAVAIITEDMITGTLFAGTVSANELFQLASGEIGSDGIPGTNIIHCYMRGEDLLALCEMDLMLNADNPSKQMHFGRMRYEYSMNRPETNRVIDVYTEEADGYYVAITGDRLYPVITTASFLRTIPEMIEKTGNVLTCNVYDETGRALTDYDVMTIRNGDGAAVKMWSAIASYIEHFDRGSDGIDVLPDNYRTARRQRTKISSLNVIKLFKHAGQATLDFWLKIVAIPLAALIGLNILVWLINLKKRKETNE